MRLTRGENWISENEIGFFTEVIFQEKFQRMNRGKSEQIKR